MKFFRQHIWGLVLVLILAIIYGVTMLPDVGGWGDTGKFQFLGHILGTPHATGYPGYLLLTFLFTSLFPVGTLAFKANLFSVICAIGACFFVFRSLKVLKVSPGIATSIALALGLTQTFWQYAIMAEVYSLNALFVSMVIYFLIKWRETRHNPTLLLACFIYAISFGNHLTMICFLPALVVFLLMSDPKQVFTKTNILWVLGFIVLGASQYLYLYWRYLDPSAIFLEMQISDWETFWWYISGAQFKSQFFPYSLTEIVAQEIPYAADLLFRQWSLFLLIAVVGMARARDKIVVLFLTLLFAGYGFLVVNYGIFDIYSYYLPLTMVLAIFIGLGLQDLFQRYLTQHQVAGTIIAAVIPLTLLAANYGFVDLSEASAAEDTQAVLELVKEDAVIIPRGYAQATHLWYYLLGEGLGPEKNLSIAFQDPMVPLVDEVVDYLEDGKALYLPFERRKVESGLPVFVIGQATVELFEDTDLDFELIDLRNDLYLAR